MDIKSFTPAQKTTFLNWLNTNASGQTEDQAAALANALASPNYFVWLKFADKSAVDAQINKANYTPAGAIPVGTGIDLTLPLQYANRAMLCQLKQSNAQWLTSGPAAISTIDARQASVRQNFKDCLLAIPSGNGGIDQDAGWGNATTPGAVRNALMRKATAFEQLFAVAVAASPGNVTADGRGAATNPDILGTATDGSELAGPVSAQLVSDIRGGL